MKNPFVYGQIVTGEDFADREQELESLFRDLSDNERIFLISPRRYGKTSLIISLLNKLKEAKIATIYIDLYKVTSLRKLLELFTREIVLAAETKIERAINFVKDLLPGLKPKITLDSEGKPVLTLDYMGAEKDVKDCLEEIYNLPEKLSKKKNKNFVIAFDEFQEIRNLDGGSIEKRLRSVIQHQKNVGYLFAGSKQSIIDDMIHNETRPFYKMGKSMYLEKIPREKFKVFLRHKFIKTGFSVEDETMEEILEFVNDYPYNAQFLCHELWDINLDEKKIRESQITIAISKIVNEESPFYNSIWDQLTMHQRLTLQGIATFGGKKIFSEKFVKESNTSPVATLQTSIKLLIKKEILKKNNSIYEFTDIFFKEWVKRKAI